jgi:hypothetical protein
MRKAALLYLSVIIGIGSASVGNILHEPLFGILLGMHSGLILGWGFATGGE